MYFVFNACNMVISDRKSHEFTWWCSHGLNLMGGPFESTSRLINQDQTTSVIYHTLKIYSKEKTLSRLHTEELLKTLHGHRVL